jgi:tetratricopeptide (TPR) repeat protein
MKAKNRVSVQVKELLAEDRVADALDLLRNVTKSSSLEDELIIITARYNNIRSRIANGTISDEYANLEQNRLLSNILDFVSRYSSALDSGEINVEGPTEKSSPENDVEDLKAEIEQLISNLESHELTRVIEEFSQSTRGLSKGEVRPEVRIRQLTSDIIKLQKELLELSNEVKLDLVGMKEMLNPDLAPDQIIKIGRDCLLLNIEDQEITLMVAEAYQQIDDHQSALIFLNRRLDQSSSDNRALFLKARSFTAREDYGGAIEILNNLYLSESGDGEVVMALADNYVGQENFSTAVKLYEESKGLMVDSPEPATRLGNFYNLMGDTSNALENFMQAHEWYQKHGEPSPVADDIAKLYLDQGKQIAAIPFLRAAIEKNPENKEAVFYLGRAEVANEQFDEAISVFKRYLELDPRNQEVVETLGDLFRSQGREAEAVQYFEGLNQTQSENTAVLIELGRLLFDLGKTNQSRVYLEAALDADPDNVWALALLGESHFQEKNFGEALNLFEHALAVDTERPDIWEKLGRLYVELNEYDKALDAFKQAERLEIDTNFQYNLSNPILLSSIELKGISFFDDFVWHCRPNVNVLLGRNGYGKSYFLRFILSLLQKEHKISFNFFGESQNDALVKIKLKRTNGKEEQITRRLTAFDSIGKIPILAIPDVRFMDRSSDTVSLYGDDKSDLAANGAYHFMFNKPYEGLIQNFLYELCITYIDRSRDYENAREAFEKIPIFNMLEEVFQELTGSQFAFDSVESIGNARFQMTVVTEGNEQNPLPIQKSSQGTLSVLAIFGLIFNYLRTIYPEVKADRLLDQSAIVVIDEIDAHLHPVWQKKIVFLLRKKFPNIQFFFTAHSPLVVGGCRKGEVCVLRKSQSGKELNLKQLNNDFIGWDTSRLYEEVFRIEEMDETYLEYKGKLASLESMRSKVQEMEKRDPNDMSREERTQFTQMVQQVQELSSFDQGREEADVQAKIEELEMQNRRLKYELDQLKNNKKK